VSGESAFGVNGTDNGIDDGSEDDDNDDKEGRCVPFNIESKSLLFGIMEFDSGLTLLLVFVSMKECETFDSFLVISAYDDL